MGVRPLNGLVSITVCATRVEADAAVARLAEAGIDAVVLGQSAATGHEALGDGPFSILVAIAIADDAQQVLVRGGRPPGPAAGSSPSRHPSLLPGAGDGGGDGRPTGPPPLPTDATSAADAAADERSPDVSRPAWFRAVAWLMVGSVLLPLVLSALRAIGQL